MANNEELKLQFREEVIAILKYRSNEHRRAAIFKLLEKIFRSPDKDVQDSALGDIREYFGELVDIQECYRQWTFTTRVSDVRYVAYDPRFENPEIDRDPVFNGCNNVLTRHLDPYSPARTRNDAQPEDSWLLRYCNKYLEWIVKVFDGVPGIEMLVTNVLFFIDEIDGLVSVGDTLKARCKILELLDAIVRSTHGQDVLRLHLCEIITEKYGDLVSVQQIANNFNEKLVRIEECDKNLKIFLLLTWKLSEST